MRYTAPMMIVVLEDDNCLHVYESIADVVQHVESLDAQDVLRAVFDQDGQCYRIEWIKPNRRAWLGVENGEYRLIADGTPSIAAIRPEPPKNGFEGCVATACY